MKIGIVEVRRNHYDFLIAIYKIYKQIFPDCVIKLYTTQDTYENLITELKLQREAINVEDIFIFKTEDLKEQIKELEAEKIDLTIFSTIPLQRNMIYYVPYFFQHKKRIIIAIHNINSWFKIGKFKITNLIIYMAKKLLLYNTKYVILLNNNLKIYFDRKVNRKIPSVVVPFKLPLKNKVYSEDRKLCIVIPGTVELRRRNYLEIMNGFLELVDNEVDFEVVLLGEMLEKKVENLILDTKLKNCVRYFKGYVSQEQFDMEMKRADLILAPTQEYFNYESISMEKYGVTKASGAEFDSIKYQIPLIINSQYTIDESFADSIVHYNNYKELNNILEKVINDKGYFEQLKLEAEKNLKNFSVENVAKKVNF